MGETPQRLPGKVGGRYLHDSLSVGAIHLDFLKHLHKVLGLHPDSMGKACTPQ